jgi:uncharacterized membrane protein
MLARLQLTWATLRDSLWFLPAVLTAGAALLAITLVRIEVVFRDSLPTEGRWIMGGSADGARSVLSTVAGSLITVTGVVFSVTVVALQLASSQFTPRILRNFMADRINQLVLGVLIATFTFALLVLRVVRSSDEGEEFVPHISVSVAILLSLISIAFLIYFIHHAARSIQASVILATVTSAALDQVQRLFPQEIGEPESEPLPMVEVPSWKAERVLAERDGYLQAVDQASLFQLGERHQILIRMAQPVGAFVVVGQVLAEVWSKEPLEADIQANIRHAFVLGEERTPEQDLEFFFLEISDMAVKALSPSINDPTTASHCLDRLTQILLAFGKRRPPPPLRTKSGSVHFLALPIDFEGAVETAFAQICHFGKDNSTIVRKIRRSLELLEEHLPLEHQASIRAFRCQLERQIAESMEAPAV